MDQIEFLSRLAVSMAIGGLIGLEREQHRDHEPVIAGVRTYPLISLSGMLFAYLAIDGGVGSAIPIGLAMFGAIALAYIYIRHDLKLTGFTSPVAMVVTYIIGVLVGHGRFVEGVALGVAITFVLLAKGRLHAFALAVTQAEMMGALQFILVAFILYPVALSAGPMVVRGVDLSEIVSLPTVILTVVMVSLISFFSFVAIRYAGPTKGLAAAGVLGGLVNSEAATASLTDYARKNPKLVRTALSGMVLANTGMLARNLAISAFSDPSFLTVSVAVIPALAMSAVSVLYFIWAEKQREQVSAHEIRLESPFGMRPAVLLGLLIGFTSVLVYILSKNPWVGGAWSVYFTALIGFVSSAAVTFSVGTLAFTGHLSPLVAGEVTVLACLASTLNKLIIIRSGSPALTRRAWKLVAGILVAGLLGYIAIDIYLRTVLGWS